MRNSHVHVVAAVIVAVLAAGCGDDGGPATTTPTATSNGPFESVAFDTTDGFALEGRLYGGGPIWVILGHMLPADQDSWSGFARDAAAAGYTVLTYNNRGHGESQGNRNDPSVGVDADAALRFARSRGAVHPFYFGASMNGAAAMALAAREDLGGIATLSGVQAFGDTDGIGALPDVTEPKLFVAARDDQRAVNDLREFLIVADDPKSDLILDIGGHGTDMFDENRLLLTQTLLDFLAEHG